MSRRTAAALPSLSRRASEPIARAQATPPACVPLGSARRGCNAASRTKRLSSRSALSVVACTSPDRASNALRACCGARPTTASQAGWPNPSASMAFAACCWLAVFPMAAKDTSLRTSSIVTLVGVYDSREFRNASPVDTASKVPLTPPCAVRMV